MKNNSLKSFRFEIVLYSLYSMLLTLLTIAVLMVGCIAIYVSMGGELPVPFGKKQEEVKETILSNSTNINNFVSNNTAINNKVTFGNGMREEKALDRGMLVILIICISILAVCIFLLYFLKFTKKFSYYISEITEGIEEISHGNFNHSIEISSTDEFGIIAERMNQMTRDVDGIIEANRSGENRKHELITSVAHDLRTPLTSIIGYLELLRSSKVEEETKEHYLEIVYQKSKRLEQLVEDLFSYTKYTYGSVAAIKDPVDIVKLLEQMLDEFYPAFEENSLNCQFYKDCSSLISYADGNLLARAFANLLSNAIKYGAEGKKVELYLTHKGNEIQIKVKNYGTTIPEQDLPHIFERFYRVEDSRSRETGGSGLGLAITKSIIAMHRGEIDAKSDLNGTVFEVRLPMIREPETNH